MGTNQDKHMRNRDDSGQTNQKWLTCSASRQQHEADKLRITQIIPSDGKIRGIYVGYPSYCKFVDKSLKLSNSLHIKYGFKVELKVNTFDFS